MDGTIERYPNSKHDRGSGSTDRWHHPCRQRGCPRDWGAGSWNCPAKRLSKSFLLSPHRPETRSLALVFSGGIGLQVRGAPRPPAEPPAPARLHHGGAFQWACGGRSRRPAALASPVVLVFPQSYFLSRAQSLCGPEHSAVPDSLRWLCHPLGQKFFMERSWSVKSATKESLYCAQRNPGENTFTAIWNWRKT